MGAGRRRIGQAAASVVRGAPVVAMAASTLKEILVKLRPEPAHPAPLPPVRHRSDTTSRRAGAGIGGDARIDQEARRESFDASRCEIGSSRFSRSRTRGSAAVSALRQSV